MDKNKQPGIVFDAVILAEVDFKRESFLPDDLEIDIKFESTRSLDENKGTIEIITNLSLKNENDTFVEMKLKHIGIFSVIEEDANMSMDSFLEFNAPALVFPYIRKEVSTITCSAGLAPVLLPPMNIIAMINQGEKD